MPKAVSGQRSPWSRSWQLLRLPAIIALLLFTLWLYIPPYWDSFVGDDFVQQWRIREFLDHPSAAYRILSPFWTDWYYRPLQNLWFLTNRLIFGLKPFAYYYLQISLHLISVALLYHMSRRLKVVALGALIAAALFAVNAEHQLTVSWISSIGIVLALTLSLVAVSLLLAYLRRPRWVGLLVLMLVAAALAMLAQEEDILLPIILAAVWWSEAGLRRPRRAEVAAGVCLAALSVTYVVFQLVRPNANLSVGDSFVPNIVANLSPEAIGRFAQGLLLRWLLLEDGAVGRAALGLGANSPILPLIVLAIVGALIFLWFRWGDRPIRLGLLWAVLHLGFIYVVVYSQRPELFDGRHLYQAWAGLSLAIGGTVGRLLSLRDRFRERRRLSTRPVIWVTAALAIVIVLQAGQVQRSHRRVLGLAQEVRATELQIRSILPSINEDTRVFATRFLLTPSYFVPVASVWYEQPHLTGGDLDSLAQYQQATSDFYVFDYDNGRLYELMPELQQHRATVLIWSKVPTVAAVTLDGRATQLTAEEYDLNAIVASVDERRLAVVVPTQAGAWTTLAFDLEAPPGSQLAFGIRGEAGDVFRVRLADDAGEAAILFEQKWAAGDSRRWHDVILPLPQDSTEQVRLFFEVMGRSGGEPGSGYWANPRLITD